MRGEKEEVPKKYPTIFGNFYTSLHTSLAFQKILRHQYYNFYNTYRSNNFYYELETSIQHSTSDFDGNKLILF